MKKIIIIGASVIVFLIAIILIGYNLLLGPTSNSTDIIEINVTKGNTYFSVASILKQKDLIKSELAYKIYIKLSKPKSLEAGRYKLTKKMGVKEIVKVLASGSNYNSDTVKITVPEGKHITDVATIAAKITNNKAEDLIALWDSSAFVDKAIKKYWFITEDIKKKGVKHPLEGYFFPSTYELLNKDVDGEYIAYKFLDQMDKVLSKYKEDIEASKYSVHELLTMASIVEYEAILDEDRPIIAGVFYNRLNKKMKLESCATVGYAIGEWKLTYSTKDLAVKSPYNTYYYDGLPIGPGNSPSEESIKAAIYPSTTDYLFFMADVCDPTSKKTYYSKTYEGHKANIKKYLGCIYG